MWFVVGCCCFQAHTCCTRSAKILQASRAKDVVATFTLLVVVSSKVSKLFAKWSLRDWLSPRAASDFASASADEPRPGPVQGACVPVYCLTRTSPTSLGTLFTCVIFGCEPRPWHVQVPPKLMEKSLLMTSSGQCLKILRPITLVELGCSRLVDQ